MVVDIMCLHGTRQMQFDYSLVVPVLNLYVTNMAYHTCSPNFEFMSVICV